MPQISAARDIALSSICVTLPMLLLTAALVAFVLRYSVGSDVQVPRDDAFYVHINSTLVIFIASWMSSLAPLLGSFLVNLTTYPVAGQLLTDSTKTDQSRLLTPFQLQLVLKIIHGSIWSGLWGWVRYKLAWRKRPLQHGVALSSLSLIALVSMLLGVAIFAADTWLHIATTSIDVFQDFAMPASDILYSLEFRPNCLEGNNSFSAVNSSRISCTLNPSNYSSVPSYPSLYEPESALLVLNDISTNLSIANNAPDPTMLYLSIAPSRPNPNDDYTARTFAIGTTCTPISRACNLTIDGDVTFNCNNGAFTDNTTDLTDSGLLRQCFQSPDMSDTTDIWQFNGVKNPFYVAGASLDTADDGKLNPRIIADPEAVTYPPVLAAIHMCTVSVYDVEYDLKNGTFTRFTTTMSNLTVTNAFMAPFCGTLFGSQNIQLDLNVATQLATDFQDWGRRLAASISSNIAASGVSAVKFAPALSVHRRQDIVVARIPKAPFFLLLILDLLFVGLGLLLSMLAILSSPDARKVQFRLTITGLVAALFGGSRARGEAKIVEHLYDEYHGQAVETRIGINRTSVGGFVLATMNKSGVSLEKNLDLVFHGMTAEDEKKRFPSLYLAPESEEAINQIHPADLEAWNRSDNWI